MQTVQLAGLAPHAEGNTLPLVELHDELVRGTVEAVPVHYSHLTRYLDD